MFSYDSVLQTKLLDFLKLPTPSSWAKHAQDNLPILLVDHAHCERKAAQGALMLINRYSDKSKIINVMSPLAREELLHFEKVMALLKQYKLTYSVLKFK